MTTLQKIGVRRQLLAIGVASLLIPLLEIVVMFWVSGYAHNADGSWNEGHLHQRAFVVFFGLIPLTLVSEAICWAGFLGVLQWLGEFSARSVLLVASGMGLFAAGLANGVIFILGYHRPDPPLFPVTMVLGLCLGAIFCLVAGVPWRAGRGMK